MHGAHGRARVGFIKLLFYFHSSLSFKKKDKNRTDYYHTLFIHRSLSFAEMCPLSDGQILDWFPW